MDTDNKDRSQLEAIKPLMAYPAFRALVAWARR